LNRLFRSRRIRIIGGVAGGLAEYFEVDVVLIRLLWIVAAFVGGGGILAYIIAWIVIPEERIFYASEREEIRQRTGNSGPDEQQDEAEVLHEEGGRNFLYPAEENQWGFKRRRNAGLLLIGLGIIFLTRLIVGPFFHYLWPLLIIAAGIFLLLRDGKEAGK